MDNEKIKQMLNQIEVPKEDVFRAIDRGIQKGEQQKIKNTTPRKRLIVSSSIAAAIVGITFLSGFVNPQMNQVLAKTPFIGGIYEQFGDKIGLDLANQHLITELNQSLTKNGVTVQLNQAYFDGDVISITGQVNGELNKGINEEGELSFDVNFENNRGDNDPWLKGSKAFKKIENGYEFQWKFTYPYETINEDFTLPIAIHYINGIKGDWNFEIPITQEENKTLAINHSKTYQEEGVQINIKDIKLAKASSVLNFETVSKYKGDQIDFRKAVDEKGNILFHSTNNTILSETREENGYLLSLRKNISKIDENIQSITFYPYMSIAELPVQQLLNTSSFVLNSERSALAIKVNRIVEEGNKVIVDYHFEGFAEEMSKHREELLLNNLSHAFDLIDKDFVDEIDVENPVPPENHSISKNKVKLLDKNAYHFQSVFYLDREERIENYSFKNTVIQFDFTSFIEKKELQPFTVDLSI